MREYFILLICDVKGNPFSFLIFGKYSNSYLFSLINSKVYSSSFIFDILWLNWLIIVCIIIKNKNYSHCSSQNNICYKYRKMG